MLSYAAPLFCTPAKCFPGLGNGFTPLQNAFPVWETALHPCKMLSRFGKRLYTLAKCFPGLGNDFTPFCKMLSQVGKRFYIFLEIVLTKQLSFEI